MNRRIQRPVLLCTILLLAAYFAGTPLSGQEDRPTIYVKALINGGGLSGAEADRVSQAVENAVVGMVKYQVMSQSQVKELFKNAADQQVLGCNSESCLKQIMKSTQTDFMIYGTVTKDEGEYAVTLNMMRRSGENATVTGSATQFSYSLSLKALTLMAGNAVKQLHGQKTEKAQTVEIGQEGGEQVGFTVTTNPPGAELYVNNARRGTTPKQLRYPEGTFSAKLTCPGFKTREFTVDLPAKKEYHIDLEREKYPIAFIPASGMPEGISVSEGDRKLGVIGRGGLNLSLDSGEHLFTFTMRGYDDKQTAVNLMKAGNYPVSLKRSEYTLAVKTSVPARIYLNNKLLGTSPVEKKLFLDTYTVKVEADGYLPEERVLPVEKNTALDFTLQKRQFIPFRVTSDPEGAEIYFGGKKQGAAPGTFQWPEGDVTVQAVRGDQKDEKALTLTRTGKMPVLHFNLSDVPFRVVTDPPGAGVYVGGTKKGTTPGNFAMPPGEHTVTVKLGDKEMSRKVLLARGGMEQVLDFNLAEPVHGTAKTVGGMEFVYIRGGEFMMGSPDGEGYSNEHPRHLVKVGGFWMGKFEVTQNQYEDIVGNNPSYFKGLFRGSYPVETVSWNDARQFCQKFSQKYSVQARLPYEAEWEYACRAGSTTSYYWGDVFDGNYLWYYGNSGNTTHAVGGKLPNAWGLYDMSGNVWEWCEDWYETYYGSSPYENPTGPGSGSYRVLRGGSWDNNDDGSRPAYRDRNDPTGGNISNGFRVVLSPQY